ncbi:SagB/ThcOx family dehydrogenase [Meiothermus granaticius]|uniref:SagB-type dehydrogenase domain protein n=1 Tax=Meiothermus granaticius NBRC 107808 TaxID=1227551 RepID=A0A399FDN0_9DEIN|nr:SagB/ThcOx family dehydrogenase [Meiothermus granaticius]MCL6527690.1 SagB/ThcOx family dehydrogenase [Thermaceae bacterium]RIH93916.1 SagB-type dehydrogenase domain protein [Meiothermus granaticius NBRC 107808]GEM87838.1 glucose-1-phosphate adenylyltransferase [Meiothermus granaticius NBRC 107808]
MDKHPGKVFYRLTRIFPGDELPGGRAPAAKVYANPLESVDLPEPARDGGAAVWRVLSRISPTTPQVGASISPAELSQLLAPLAVKRGARGYPSAGGAYPLELYLGVQRLQDTFPGTYHYAAKQHQLEQLTGKFDLAGWRAALMDLEATEHCAALLVFTAVPERSEAMFGVRGYRYALLEAGYAVGEVMVAATALGLQAYPAETFYDEEIRKLLGLPETEHPVVVLLLGR